MGTAVTDMAEAFHKVHQGKEWAGVQNAVKAKQYGSGPLGFSGWAMLHRKNVAVAQKGCRARNQSYRKG